MSRREPPPRAARAQGGQHQLAPAVLEQQRERVARHGLAVQVALRLVASGTATGSPAAPASPRLPPPWSARRHAASEMMVCTSTRAGVLLRQRAARTTRSIFSVSIGSDGEAAERGIAGTEVVDGDPDASAAQHPQLPHRRRRILVQRAFGDLDVEPARRASTSRGSPRGTRLAKSGRRSCIGRDVHGDAHGRQTRAHPVLAILRRLSNDPFTHVDDQARGFEQRQERAPATRAPRPDRASGSALRRPGCAA